MADLLNQFGSPMEQALPLSTPPPIIPSAFDFNVINRKPFILSEQPENELDEIKDEVMDKVITWEKRMSPMFEGMFVAADSWRIKPRSSKKRDSKTLFDSKSGETHRATETLATIWQRMLTAADPYFEGVAMGLNPMGQPIGETEIYATEQVLQEQQRISKFKKKLWSQVLLKLLLSAKPVLLNLS